MKIAEIQVGKTYVVNGILLLKVSDTISSCLVTAMDHQHKPDTECRRPMALDFQRAAEAIGWGLNPAFEKHQIG